MVHLSLVRLDRGRADADSWARDLVQPRVDDPVLAAAECKPNATGTYWFSSMRGFGERQLLEARGAYLGGRLVLVVTSVEVCVFELVFGGHLIRDAARLRRADVRACLVPARTDRPSNEAWPAALLYDEVGRELVEVRVAREDGSAWDLLAALFALSGANSGR